jgi:hypothetical protein
MLSTFRRTPRREPRLNCGASARTQMLALARRPRRHCAVRRGVNLGSTAARPRGRRCFRHCAVRHAVSLASTAARPRRRRCPGRESVHERYATCMMRSFETCWR